MNDDWHVLPFDDFDDRPPARRPAPPKPPAPRAPLSVSELAARIKQQLTCSADGKVLERNEIVKGYEYSKGEYVVIEPDEIKKIEREMSKMKDKMTKVWSETSIFFDSEALSINVNVSKG